MSSLWWPEIIIKNRYTYTNYWNFIHIYICNFHVYMRKTESKRAIFHSQVFVGGEKIHTNIRMKWNFFFVIKAWSDMHIREFILGGSAIWNQFNCKNKCWESNYIIYNVDIPSRENVDWVNFVEMFSKFKTLVLITLSYINKFKPLKTNNNISITVIYFFVFASGNWMCGYNTHAHVTWVL